MRSGVTAALTVMLRLNTNCTRVSAAHSPTLSCISRPTEGLPETTEHLHIFLSPPITQWCSISDVPFTGKRAVSDFSVLKYY